MKKTKKIITIICCIVIAIMAVVYAENTSESIVKSINICINVIIPSMFIYMVLSSYIISGSIYKTIFKPFYKLLHGILKLDETTFSIFFLSLIGGYPVGIKLFKEIIAQNKNYSEIAEKSAVFCYCISPTFAITMIGIGIYNSVEVGAIIYISNALSCFITAVIYSNMHNLKYDGISINQGGNLISAINSSSSSLFRICSVIITFNAVIAALESSFESSGLNIPIIIKSFLEISNVLSIENSSLVLLPVISAIASTGGLCVLFQCYSICSKSFKLKKFVISRIPCSILSGIITYFLLKFWDISIPTVTGSVNYTFRFNENWAVILLILIMFMILLQKNEKNFKKG